MNKALRDYILKLEREAEIEAVKNEIRRLSGEKREKLGRAILNLNGKVVGQEFKLVIYGRRREFETEIGVGDLVLISRGDTLKSDLTAKRGEGIKALEFLLGLRSPAEPEKADFKPLDEQLNASQREADGGSRQGVLWWEAWSSW